MFPTYEEAFNSTNIPYDELNHIHQEGKRKSHKRIWFIVGSLLLTLMAVLLYNYVDDLYYVQGNGDAYAYIEWLNILIYVALFSIVVTVIFFLVHYFKYKRAYKLAFKRTVIGPLANNIVHLAQIPEIDSRHKQVCKYDPERYISRSLIRKSQLFNVDYDDVTGEDLFQGQLGITEFQFSEIHLTREDTTTDNNGSSTTTTVTVFDGLLFVADFKKDFHGFTVVETRSNAFKKAKGIGKVVGNIITSLSSNTSLSGVVKVELENEEFNQTFRVRATDEIEARYILSSTMMERLMNFRKSHNYGMAISFNESNMFIAIESRRDFFDTGIEKRHGKYNVEGAYNDLVFLFSIVEEFDLNTRIWSKV